jgi:tetratricopeptide (TPR) repeat protein
MWCFNCDTDARGTCRTCVICGRPLETEPDRYFKAGMKAMADENLDRCISILNDCVELNPGHLSGRYNLGLALALANRCDEAIAHYLIIREQDPDYPGVYTALGQAAFGSYLHHLTEAESLGRSMFEFFMAALEQDPDDVDAHFSLANANLALEDPDQALPWLTNALRLDPNSSAIYFSMAKAFKMLKKFPEARVMATKSMQLSSPEDPFRQDIEDLLSEVQASILPL